MLRSKTNKQTKIFVYLRLSVSLDVNKLLFFFNIIEAMVFFFVKCSWSAARACSLVFRDALRWCSIVLVKRYLL